MLLNKANFFSLLLCFSTFTMLGSCSSIRQLSPLKKNEQTVSITLGGPLTGQISWMPIPQLGIGYNRGLIDSVLDIEAGIYVTSAICGVLHLETGLNLRPWLADGARPGLVVNTSLFFLTNFMPENFRVYPDLKLTTYWEINNFLLPYAGLESWFEFHTERTDGNKQKYHWIPAVYAGLNAGKNNWQFAVEGRLYTPNLKNSYRAPENVGIGEYGCWGMMIGVTRKFGEKRN